VGTTLVIGGIGLLALLHRDLIQSMRSQAQVEAAGVEALASRGPLPNLVLANVPSVTVVQLVDANGQVIAASPPLAGRPPLMTPRPGRTIRQRTLENPAFSPHDRFEVFAVPITLNGRPATVIVAKSLADFEHSVHVLGKFLLVALPLLLALVATSSWVIIGRSLRPVEAMRTEVAEITTRQLGRRVPEPESDDEVGRLASTLNQMLDRLEASTDRQRRFVADASHELRSPIANIRAALEVALRHPEITNWTAVARDVLDQDERMASLVDELLLLARFDEGSAMPQGSAVDLAEIINRQADQASVSGPTVQVIITEPAIVLADRGHLERVVGNLVDNATRHANTAVQLSVQTSTDRVELRIRDDGPGIPVADRARIFQRFVRLQEDRARASGGFGLGLAIVKELVGRYGGTIEVGDARPGAVFIVRLPRHSTPSVTAEPPAPAKATLM
jgi:signal transduction histidine kinase